MSWNWFKFLRIATTSMRDALALTVGSPIYTLDRNRLALHNGTSWDEVAYRSDFPIGTLILNEFNKSASEIFPAIPRNVDNDLSATNWPLLVPLLRAEKANVLGVTDHAVTVSGSVVTFPSTTAAKALLQLLVNDAIVSNYQYQGEPASFTGGTKFDVSGKQRCLNVAGTDYVITAVDLVGYTVTVSGTPTTGSQTACVYTYRIAGSTTTARLRKMSGFVGVVAGDAGGEVVGGFFKMDRGQGHNHQVDGGSVLQAMQGNNEPLVAGTTHQGYFYGSVLSPVTDNVNGTPRTGKTTDPRSYGQYAYTWGGKYVA